MDLESEKPSITEIVGSYPFRLGIYGLTTLVLYQMLYLGVMSRGAVVMGSEHGPMEIAQVVLAIIAAVCFFYAARTASRGRCGLIICGALVGYAAARESDEFFERVFFDDAYKWLVGLPLAVVALVALTAERKRLTRDLLWQMRQPAATLFVVAGIFLCAVCQTLDRPGMWLSVSDGNEAAQTKAMIEEFAELFAYLLLFFSAIESVILARFTRIASSSSSSHVAPLSLDQVHSKRAA